MAIDLNSVRFLTQAKKDGVSFERVLMFGRQNLDVFPARLRQYFEQRGIPTGALMAALEKAPQPLFAEPVFQALGAGEVCSLDASAYQSATYVHDMNLPVAESLKNRFDVVYDGGSLEHVFNVPVALKNCMEMVRPGGRLFLHTPANNWFGHGFYQFSPEFFYRVFSEDNGFEVERMIAHPVGPYGRWYQVRDPQKIGGRIELITFYPVLLLIRARRTRVADIFARAPQQSDYTATWTREEKPALTPSTTSDQGYLQRHFPGAARLWSGLRTGLRFYREHSFRNRKSFIPSGKP